SYGHIIYPNTPHTHTHTHTLTRGCLHIVWLHILTGDEHCLVCAGNCGDVNLVRLGSERTICAEVVAFSLDRQTKSRTGEAPHTELHTLQTKVPWLCFNMFLSSL